MKKTTYLVLDINSNKYRVMHEYSSPEDAVQRYMLETFGGHTLNQLEAIQERQFKVYEVEEEPTLLTAKGISAGVAVEETPEAVEKDEFDESF